MNRGVINNTRELEFAVFCIENVAAALGKPSGDVYRALSGKDGILRQYVVPSYDVLHTQGREYIVNDILEVMKERHVAVRFSNADFDVYRSGGRMTANRNLLRMKFARVIERYAANQGCSLAEALDRFYRSDTYKLMRDGVSEMHCMSEAYLAEELEDEWLKKSAAGQSEVRCG